MSNLSPMRGNARPGLPIPPQGDTIASYKTYAEAQRAVDFLSDRHFPVQAVTIVGVDLQMVERVTGRLTYARVAVAGLASGAYFGVFVGFLLFLLGNGQNATWLAAIPLGAAFGLAFGLISYSLTGGRRDFTSTSQIVASDYRVLCLSEQAGQAMQLLRQLDGGAGVGMTPPAPSQPLPTQPPGPQPGPQQGQWGPPAFGSREPGAPPVGMPPEGSGSLTADGTPPAEQTQPAPTGPTYGEMMERKRREEREAAERGSSGSDQS